MSGGALAVAPQHFARLPVVTPHAWPTPTETVIKLSPGGEHAKSLVALPSSAPLWRSSSVQFPPADKEE